MQRKVITIVSLLLFASLAVIVPTLLKSVEFGHPFSVLKAKRKLTHQELIRAIRMMIAAEYEAVQLYTQLAESTDNELAKKVLIHVANEERVHAGEFLRLLKHLAPDEERHYQEGYKEVEAEMREQEQQKSIKKPATK